LLPVVAKMHVFKIFILSTRNLVELLERRDVLKINSK